MGLSTEGANVAFFPKGLLARLYRKALIVIASQKGYW
jgi:hypothetical protein